jgi:hypothetical protein
VFVRNVTTFLRANSISKFSWFPEKEVIPQRKKGNGFQDELTFFVPNEYVVTSISMWDRPSSTEAYSRGTSSAVLKKLPAIIEGMPKVAAYEVIISTVHKVAAAAA